MSNDVLTLIITIGITVVGWATMFGICKQKIDDNEKDIQTLKADFQKDIDEVKARQNETSAILQSINNNLSDLNSKFNLLLNGQLVIKGFNND